MFMVTIAYKKAVKVMINGDECDVDVYVGVGVDVDVCICVCVYVHVHDVIAFLFPTSLITALDLSRITPSNSWQSPHPSSHRCSTG